MSEELVSLIRVTVVMVVVALVALAAGYLISRSHWRRTGRPGPNAPYWPY